MRGQASDDVSGCHLLQLGVREGFLLRVETGVFEHDDVPDHRFLDRVESGLPEEARHVAHRVSQEDLDPRRVGLQGREVVLPGPRLVGEDDDLRVPQFADRREMLPNPRIVQQLAGGGIDRRVDVNPEKDGAAREVEVIHREEIAGHQGVTKSPRVIVFLPRVLEDSSRRPGVCSQTEELGWNLFRGAGGMDARTEGTPRPKTSCSQRENSSARPGAGRTRSSNSSST